MGSIEVMGKNRLHGEITIQGSKNAVLPIMAAAILNRGTTVIENCPRILDVSSMMKLLDSIGCKTELIGNRLTIDAKALTGDVIASEYVRRLRASVLLLGVMLGRMGYVQMTLPGGCSIGERPIDYHLKAFQCMAVEVTRKGEDIYCKTTDLQGSEITLPFPSVGATENIILAAVMANGRTAIHNAAREPEIRELCKFLNCMGADVSGAGTSHVQIQGVKRLHDVAFRMASDRIVTGTYCCAVAGTGGDVVLRADCGEQMVGILPIIRKLGCQAKLGNDFITLKSSGKVNGIPYLKTMPFPDFPTDMQSQVIAVLCLADRQVSVIEESIFEARFQVVEPLRIMGADIQVLDNKARITGVKGLYGAHVEACELRGGAALTLAGLFAEGKTTVKGLYYVQRGYEDIVRDFNNLGADIKYIRDEESET